MQEYDRFFFQGGDPKTNSFFFFAVQDTPENNDREDRNTYSCQVIVSWPYRAGFLGRSEPMEIPVTNEQSVHLMKEITDGWISPFRDRVQEIPNDTPVQAIRLEDWPPEVGAWDNLNGKATLIGDAAHAMTMCRSRSYHTWTLCTLTMTHRPWRGRKSWHYGREALARLPSSVTQSP